MWKNIFLILIVSLFCSALVYADPIPGTGFKLYFHAPEKTELGSYIVLEAGSYELSKLKETLFSFKGPSGKTLAPTPNEPVEIVIVVPKGAPDQYVKAYVLKVKEQLGQVYRDQARYNIKISYIDTDAEVQTFTAAIKTLKLSPPELPADEVGEGAKKELLVQLEKNQEDLEIWRSTWYGRGLQWLNDRDPKNRTTAAKVVGLIKGTTTLSVTLTKYGLHTSSFLIGLASGAISATFGWFAVEFSQWCTSHKLPLTKRLPWLEKIPGIGYYNNSPIVKSNTINLFRSMGIAYLVRLAAYLTGEVMQTGKSKGKPVENPTSWKFVAESAGLTAVEIAADSAVDVGARALAEKNYINYTSRSYLLWGIGMIDTVMHALFRSGDTRAAYTILGVNSVVKLSVFLLSKLLPPNPRRIVVVSDLITPKDFGFIKKQLTLGGAWNLAPSEEALVTLRSHDVTPNQVSELLNLGDISGVDLEEITRLIRENGNTVAACTAMLE